MVKQKSTRERACWQYNELQQGSSKSSKCGDEPKQRLDTKDLKKLARARNLGGKNNQKFHAWSFKQFTDTLQYKLRLKRIRLVSVNEKSTSKTCSRCGQVRKKTGRREDYTSATDVDCE